MRYDLGPTSPQWVYRWTHLCEGTVKIEERSRLGGSMLGLGTT